MASTEFSDRAASIRLRQQLAEAVERAYALAWAIVRLEGRAEGAAAESAARDAIIDALIPEPAAANVVSFSRQEARLHEVRLQDARSQDTRLQDARLHESRLPEVRVPEGGASAQEMLLAILKENEASVRELQTALDDCGLAITPGNLSVILSRMNQAGLIRRTGRGLYSYAR